MGREGEEGERDSRREWGGTKRKGERWGGERLTERETGRKKDNRKTETKGGEREGRRGKRALQTKWEKFHCCNF